ncbi:MAG: cysteine desulfurase family protein [Proteobacteria bacterium]|nr:cysteine desulfurase family protein [Pseudomonadota bacterium]
MIYLDHNATTPMDDRVVEAMRPFMGIFFGNPSSLHRLGRTSRSAIDTARSQVAALVGVEAAQVIFTSGGTEANNLAIKGLAGTLAAGVIAVGATEHPSVLAPAWHLHKQGWEVLTLAVDSAGALASEGIAGLPKPSLRIASVMLANNETGVVLDVSTLARFVRETGAYLHCDAVQAAGKMPVNFNASGAHLLTLSSHKIYGPKGAGALVVDKSVPLEPLLEGGGQERGLRSGTENVAAIVGFGKACELALAELESRNAHCLQLRLQLENRLAQLPGVTLFAGHAPRLSNTLQFGLGGMDGEALLMALDRKGFAVSSGSACASGAGEPSPILLAMGVAADTAKSAIRVSVGKDNSEAEIETFFAALSELNLCKPSDR